MCQSPHQQCFGDAGNAFNERMRAGKNRDQCLIDHMFVANDHLGDFLFCF
jgi:hypothetical protein